MTRKHFELIAEAIKDFDFVNHKQRLDFATQMANIVCKPLNSNFKQDRFLKACGVPESLR